MEYMRKSLNFKWFCPSATEGRDRNDLPQMNPRKIFSTGVLACALTFFCACTSTRDDISYFQDINQIPEAAWSQTFDAFPRIKMDDELSIIINSVDMAAAASFNKTSYIQQSPLAHTASTLPNLQTYRVDAQGNIEMPVLGMLHVEGMTTQELQDQLRNTISQYIKDPIVSVNLMTFTVTVLGEVTAPGVCYFSGNRATLLEAIGQRGDLSIFGRRDNVQLIREVNGRREHHTIDLTSADCINSPYYYLQQNDVIYVSPNESKRDTSRYNNLKSYNISVISTILGAVSMLSTLAIAIWK